MPCYCKITAPALSGIDASEFVVAGPNTVEPSALERGKGYKESRFVVLNAYNENIADFNGANRWVVKKKGETSPHIICSQDLNLSEKHVFTAKLLAERLQDVYAFYLECFGWEGRRLGHYFWPPHSFINWREEENAVFDSNWDSGAGCLAFGQPTWKEYDRANFATLLDIVGHECTHVIIEDTTRLEYKHQSGALNESLADCLGIMLKHWKLQQRDPNTANWVIGSGMDYPYSNGIRSLKSPENYCQPRHMDEYDELGGEDNSGVHHNSGIPNRAFYLAATKIGHPSWETVGTIWYKSMTDKQQVTPKATFEAFAEVTIYHSPVEFKSQVRAAWEEVGVNTPALDI